MQVTFDQANQYIESYVNLQTQLTEPSRLDGLEQNVLNYYNSNLTSFVFTRDKINQLLNDSDANALRIYYGAQSNGFATLVLVGCKKDGVNFQNVFPALAVSSGVGAAEETPVTPPHIVGPGPKRKPDIRNDDFSGNY